jgi:dTDP-L-rhamnose 4-epimerase
MRVLVTGGAGFIGSHLVDGLIFRGHTVRVLDSLVPQVHPGGRPQYLNPEAEFIQGDVGHRDGLKRALNDIDVVFHQAAEVGVGQSMYELDRYVAGNTRATGILLEEVIARKTKIKKLIVASSMSLYGEGSYNCGTCGPVAPQLRSEEQLNRSDWNVYCPQCGGLTAPANTPEEKQLFPTSVYAITKQDQEQLCLVIGRAYRIPTVALRYFNVYGTRQTLSNPYTGVCAIFSSRLLNSRAPVVFEDGGQTRDFVHVEDIVQANLLALESSKADFLPINIGTGVATSIGRVAELLASGLGLKIKPEYIGKYRQGDIRHCVADISRARKLLGYKPSKSLEQGIPELLAWVRKQTATDEVERATEELRQRDLVR